jgi:hypothetical protein
MSSDRTPEPPPDDEIPRRSLWASLPRRSVSRVIILLGILAGILYLRQRAGVIAARMEEAFRAPMPSPPGVRVRLSGPAAVDAGETWRR